MLYKKLCQEDSSESFSSDSSAQKICIEATDLEGVVTTSCDNLSFRVDTSAPTSGISATGNLTTSIATVTASFSDSQSGMWKYDYYYGTGDKWGFAFNSGSAMKNYGGGSVRCIKR